MGEPLRIRCSSLPLLFACRESADTEIQVGERNEAADLGSAAHEAMEAIVRGLQPEIGAIALRWSCSPDDLGPLAWYGRTAWESLRAAFPDDEEHSRFAESEFTLREDDLMLSGHPDLHVVSSDGTVRILDWKTGRVDRDHYHQLAGYAACLMDIDEHVHEVTGSIVWLRDQEIETYVFTRGTVRQWLARLRDQLKRRGQYQLGRHCEHCPRRHSCDAIKARAREGMDIFGRGDVSLADADADTILEAFRRAKLVSGVADSMIEAVRLEVTARGGRVEGTDGAALVVVEEPGPRKIDTLKAWPILQDVLPDPEAMAGVLRVSAGDLEDAVAKAAGRGKGAAAKRDLAEKLEAAGAIERGTVRRLKDLKPRKEIVR